MGVLFLLLLFVSLVLAILGITGHIWEIDKEKVPENVSHEFKFYGKLYFYNEDDILVGEYECKSDNCDYAEYSQDDDKYSLKVYSGGNVKSDMINDRYAFINDNGLFLYDIPNGRILYNLNMVKNYGIGLDDDLYIIEDTNNKWGIIRLLGNPDLTTKFDYSYIGLKNEIKKKTNQLYSNLYAVKDVNGWKLVDHKNITKSDYMIYNIYDYNGSYIITKNINQYNLYLYNASLVLAESYMKMDFVGNYIMVVDQDYNFYLIDPSTKEEISQKYKVDNIDDASCEIEDDIIIVKVKGNVVTRL